MKNNQLIDNLKLYRLTRVKHNSVLIHLDPTINILKIYSFYIKDSKYYKLHYLYLYYINLSLVGTL